MLAVAGSGMSAEAALPPLLPGPHLNHNAPMTTSAATTIMMIVSVFFGI
jgi:hypothetical protein